MSEYALLGGTDGFRGPADLNNPEMGHQNEVTHYWLTAALVSLQQEEGLSGPVAIARDGNGRPSGYRLMQADAQAALDHGAEVLLLDVAPTPVAQKVAELSGALATVVVTASHNKHTDNGWKGMLGSHKPDNGWVKKISDRAWGMYHAGADQAEMFPITKGYVDLGELSYKQQYKDGLIGQLTSAFGERPLAGKILVYDGANGAGNPMTPDILEELGADVRRIHCGDGMINDNCGATHLESLEAYIAADRDLLRDPNFLGGLANDGDADRLMAIGVTAHGNKTELVEINGNHIMYELAQGEPGIVGTLYTNTGLRDKLAQEGIAFDECDNGDKYVTEALQKRSGDGWRRGGEFTGHLIDMNWLNSGDGVAMAAWLSATIAQKGSTFGDLYQRLPLWHEFMQPVALPKGTIVDAKDSRLADIHAQATAKLSGEGRVIVRPSGTEAVVRAWLETPHQAQRDAVGSFLAASLRHAFGKVA